MTGPEHFAQAEKCIDWAQGETDRDKRASLHARAQAHATLALAAATAYDQQTTHKALTELTGAIHDLTRRIAKLANLELVKGGPA